MNQIGAKAVISVGVNGTEQIRTLADAIDSVNAKARSTAQGIGANTRQLDQYGQTARQAANNTRQLSAQFTDIGVSLATGQNPFYVLLQQGGQIKDMYGGLGNAFRAVAASLGPVGIAALAVGSTVAVLAKAFSDAESETLRFRDSQILTGSAIGLTKEQFDGLVDSVAQATGGQLPRAREVLEQLAASGKVSGDQLGLTAQTILRLSAVSGQSADEVTRSFLSMRDGVAAWALKANEAYGFINAAQYENIRQLEEQGETAAAADVAMRALYDHLGTEAVSNLGTLESAWINIKGAISGAWEALKGFTRESTRGERIAELQAQLQEMQFTVGRGGRRRLTEAEIDERFTEYRGRAGTVNVYRQREAELKKLIEQQAQEQADTLQQAERTAQNKRQTEAQAGWNKLSQTYATSGERLNREIEAIQAAGRKAVEAGLISNADVERMVAAARQKAAGPVSKANPYLDYVKQLQDGILKARDLENEVEAMTLQRIERGDFGKITEQQKEELVNLARKADLLSRIKAEESQRTRAGQRAESADNSALTAGASFSAQERERSIQALIDEREAIGATRDELDRLSYARRVDGQFARIMAKELSPEVRAALEQERDALKALYNEESRRTEQLRTSYSAGIRSFLADIRQQATDDAALIGSALSGAFNAAGDALAEFVTTGKFQFKSFVAGILADVARLFAQRAVAQLVTAVFGGFGGPSGAAAGAGNFSFSPAVPSVGSGLFGAGHSGAVVGSEYTMARAVNPSVFAGAPRFHTGGLVGGEVPIIAKRGEGVFTPAQMRALAPVDRSSGAPTNVSVNVNVESGQMSAQSSDKRGDDIGRLIGVKVLEVLRYEKRPGGMLA